MASYAALLKELNVNSILNYLRRSRQDEEREKRTGEDVLAEQKQIMDRVLEPLGIPFEQRTEVGSGDKISTRPVFQTVIDDLRSKKFDAIAVKEISRMGRGSYTDMGTIFDLIVEKRIFIITPYKIYDPQNPSDLRQIRFELFLAREEFETTRERLNGGRINSAMAGKWVAGKAPYGYVYNKNTGKLEINEEEAKIIRLIFDYYVNGVVMPDGSRRDVSFRALATYLQRNTPFLTPRGSKEWRPIVVRRLITSERFIGTMTFKDSVVHDAHDPIIDRETWEKAQAKDNDSRHKPRTKLEFSPCELAGIVVCKACGHKMVRQFSVQKYKTSTGSVSTYEKEFLWCKNIGCTFVKYRDVEEDMLDVLHYFKNDLNTDMIRQQLASVIADKRTKSDRMSADEINQYVEQRTKELKQRLKFIFEKYEQGIYSDENFLERKADIEKEIEQLKGMKPEEEHTRDIVDLIDIEVVRKNLGSILDVYRSSTNKTDKNKILRKVFDHVVVELIEKGRGRNSAKFMIYPALNYDLLDPDFLDL